MARSFCGTRSSARRTMGSGTARRRAMLIPYDRPGTPLTRRYVGVRAAVSNASDALTTPATCDASSLRTPRCVVATVSVARRVSSSRIAHPSAAPSCGSVPEPSSSISELTPWDSAASSPVLSPALMRLVRSPFAAALTTPLVSSTALRNWCENPTWSVTSVAYTIT